MTYEYVCEACGNQWEAEQSIKAAPLVKCVSCGEDKAKRLISGGTGFLLKGGGWYADLYGSPGSGAAKGEDKDKAAKAGGATPKTEGAESKSATAETTSSGESKSTGGAAATGSTPTTTATPATSSAKAS